MFAKCSPDQYRALHDQYKVVQKIVTTTPGINPFGQSIKTFELAYGVHLWSDINVALAGLKADSLAALVATGFRIRGGRSGFRLSPELDGVYIPPLWTACGRGTLLVDGQLDPPPHSRLVMLAFKFANDTIELVPQWSDRPKT